MTAVWNQITKHLKLGWVAFWYALPVVIVLAGVALVQRSEDARFDRAAFTPEAVEAYATPEALLRDLHGAILMQDWDAIGTLQGRTAPAELRYVGNLEQVGPRELFVDGQRVAYSSVSEAEWATLAEEADFIAYTYRPSNATTTQTITLQQHDGRWLLAAPDLYTLVNTGQWRGAAVRAVAFSWLGATVVLGAIWVTRNLVSDYHAGKFGQEMVGTR